MRVAIERITVGQRRRAEYGDIASLARSIERVGLIHPIVVDYDFLLIAGERRLRACQALGHKEIEVRSLGEMSDAERRLIELEENMHRLALSRDEAARDMAIVDAADQARIVAQEEAANAEFLVHSGPETRPEGRPSGPVAGSERDIAERIGVPRSTVHRAQAHVGVLDRYPEIRSLNGNREQNLQLAAALDAIPDDERPAVLAKVAVHDSPTIRNLRGLPPTDHTAIEALDRQLADDRAWQKTFTSVFAGIAEMQKRGGLVAVAARWTPQQRRSERDLLIGLIDQLTQWRTILEEAAL